MNDDTKTTYFGLTNFRNQERRFGIKKNDRRKHMYIIGKTGMGKTTLLENLAMQDIQNGEGLAFIDPHGETAYKLLDFVPRERMNDVVYFDPADTAFPVGLNVMENVDPERRHFVASGLMSVFKKIFGPDVWSARMEYILGNTVLALLEYPQSTLLSINPMLAVKEFRKKVVENITDPVIKAFWTQEFAKYTERFAAEATPAIQNKVGQFTSNALIRNIIGQRHSTFDMRRLMDERKILIVNLAKGRVGEDTARLLGTMVVTKLYLAAMSRVDVLEETRRSDFFLYVDEFQNFATEAFANILSEARKYRLDLILAHQYMAQLAEEVRDAVIGNVGTMVSFRVGAEDAEFLEKEFGPDLMATDMVNLGFAQIYLKLMIDGVASHPFSATTLPPITNQQQSCRADILEASRTNYGTPRAAVEEEIHKWSQEVEGEARTKEFADTSKQKSEGPKHDNLYDATCAVCGKITKVPFVPDPGRPVFCKEHIGLASQYPPRRAQHHREGVTKAPRYDISTRSRAPILSVGIRGDEQGEAAAKSAPPHALLLKDLARNTDSVSGARHDTRDHARKEKQDNLSALRAALKKSLESQKISSQQAAISSQQSSAIKADEGGANEEPKAEGRKPNADSGTLKPGEHVEL